MLILLFCQLVAVLPLLPVSAFSATAQVVFSTDSEICKVEMWPILLKLVLVADSQRMELDVTLQKAVFECLLDCRYQCSSFPSSCEQKDPCQACVIRSTKMEEGRVFTYPKVKFLVWVITAIMDPCTHILLLSPKREFMGQRIRESLWLCLCRLGQGCRMHGALGLFPITSAKTAGIPGSAGCV